MSELHTFSVAQLAAGLKNKDFSSTELTQHFLNRITQHDKAINSFITVTPEQALAQAAAEIGKHQTDTEQKAEVADAVDQKGF